MRRSFDFNKLPKDVKEKVELIVWNCGDFTDDIMGEVYLFDGWVFNDGLDCHNCAFTSRKDLIELVRYCTIRER